MLVTLRHPVRRLAWAGSLRHGSRNHGLWQDVVGLVVPWLMLMPGIFFSGLFLHQVIPYRPNKRTELLAEHLKSRRVVAVADNVLYGLGLFIPLLLAVGFIGGRQIYTKVMIDYGIDFGQPLSLCTLVALFSFAISFLVYIIYRLVPSDPLPTEHAERIKAIIKKKYQKNYDDEPPSRGG